MNPTVLIIPPGARPYLAAIDAAADTLRRLVGGPLQAVTRPGWHAYVDEEGKLAGSPVNPIATALLFPHGGDVIVGTAVVLGTGRGGTETSVPADLANSVLAAAAVPPRTVRGPGSAPCGDHADPPGTHPDAPGPVTADGGDPDLPWADCDEIPVIEQDTPRIAISGQPRLGECGVHTIGRELAGYLRQILRVAVTGLMYRENPWDHRRCARAWCFELTLGDRRVVVTGFEARFPGYRDSYTAYAITLDGHRIPFTPPGISVTAWQLAHAIQAAYHDTTPTKR